MHQSPCTIDMWLASVWLPFLNASQAPSMRSSREPHSERSSTCPPLPCWARARPLESVDSFELHADPHKTEWLMDLTCCYHKFVTNVLTYLLQHWMLANRDRVMQIVLLVNTRMSWNVCMNVKPQISHKSQTCFGFSTECVRNCGFLSTQHKHVLTAFK